MEYITTDSHKYHPLDGGLAFDIQWDSDRSNFRIDLMSVAEREKTDASTRSLYGSIHAKDILPATLPGISFKYLERNNVNLEMMKKATASTLSAMFKAGPAGCRDFCGGLGTEYLLLKDAIIVLITAEQQRLDQVALEQKRMSYRINLSNITATSVDVSLSGGPSGATGLWELRYRQAATDEETFSWIEVASRSVSEFSLSGLTAGKQHEFQTRRSSDDVWSVSRKRILPLQ